MQRITESMLKAQVKQLNELAGIQADSPYIGRDTTGKLIPNEGYYVIDHAYGGAKLSSMSSGGQNDILSLGYTTKRDLYNNISSYIRGYKAALERMTVV